MIRRTRNIVAAAAFASLLLAAGCAAVETAAPREDAVPVEMINGNALPSATILTGDFPTAPGIDQFTPDEEELPPQDTDTDGVCRGFRITDVLFASGRHELEAEGTEAIAVFANAIPDNAVIVIEGHTDSLPIAIGNQRLSELRAESVATALEAHLGSDQRIVDVAGVADREPIDDNATEAGRRRNRRVEILINCGGES